MTGVGWWNEDEDGVTSTLAAREFKDTARVVVSSLQGGGQRGHRIDAEGAAGGHLVPYVKGTRAASVEHDETWREDQTSPTLNVNDNNGESRATMGHAVAITGTVAHALTAPAVAYDEMNDTLGTVHHTLRAGTTQSTGVVTAATVRRLTPVECERLMGWPDGHTQFRVNLRTGDIVPQADSSRYRQCGNGMAAPVVAWIARRILEVEAS